MALGGNRRYEETLRRYPDVGIFFTPMWAANWKKIDKDVGISSKSQSFGNLPNNLVYRKVAKLDTGLHYIMDFEVNSRINEFAALYKLEIVNIQSGSEIAKKCYQKAKDSIAKR